MLAAEIAGNGVPLVFLHTYPMNRRMWKAQQAEFSRHFKTVLLDFPGFGESPAESETLSLRPAEPATMR
jgi:pimeloyl-ACP methyl ester carboxylesterase